MVSGERIRLILRMGKPFLNRLHRPSIILGAAGESGCRAVEPRMDTERRGYPPSRLETRLPARRAGLCRWGRRQPAKQEVGARSFAAGTDWTHLHRAADAQHRDAGGDLEGVVEGGTVDQEKTR